jgi:hypothetical protein
MKSVLHILPEDPGQIRRSKRNIRRKLAGDHRHLLRRTLLSADRNKTIILVMTGKENIIRSIIVKIFGINFERFFDACFELVVLTKVADNKIVIAIPVKVIGNN